MIIKTRRSSLAARRMFCAAAGATVLAGAAHAELPAILDRVPADAVAVVVTPSVDRIDKSMAALVAATQQQAPTPSQLLAIVGLARGLDTSRPAALALMPGNMGGEVPPAVLLAPVSDYAAFAQALGAQAGDGVVSGMAAGEQVFLKRLDGNYAAVSPLRATIDAFTGEAGSMAAHRERLGAAGVSAVEGADVAVIANIPALQPFLEPGLQQFEQQMGAAAGMGGMGGQNAGAMGDFARAFLRDATAGVVALKGDAMGMHTSFAANFREDSQLAKYFSQGGDASGLLRKIPDQPFLIAYAFDARSDSVREFMKSMVANNPAAGAAGLDTPGVLAVIDNISGQAGAIYPNPAGLFGGLLAKGAYFYPSDEPRTVIESYQTILQNLDGQAADGFTYSGAFSPDTQTIEGAKVSGYSYAIKPMPGSRAASPLAMMFGPNNGPSGFLAALDDGVVITTQPDQAFMATAINAAKNNQGIASNQLVRQVSDRLPSPRIAEAYIGVRPILDQVSPFLAMMPGAQAIDFANIPAQLPPVGIAASIDDGSVRIDTFVPAPILKIIGDVGTAMQQMGAQRGNQQQQNGRQAPPF